ncbi:MAG: hypothetical protein HKN34_07415, partial [Gammaproteobacteria bacterium]|nr:hypothetical protein [Gammaproteobacteria bacterium]
MSQFPNEASSVNSVVATPLQQGMVFHNMSEPGRGIDIEQITIRSSTRIDRDRIDDVF